MIAYAVRSNAACATISMKTRPVRAKIVGAIRARYDLTEDEIRLLVRRAIADRERGFGNLDIKIDDDALDLWAAMSDGVWSSQLEDYAF